jgi:hypothetical protein
MMDSIFARRKFKPPDDQRNAYKAEIFRFAARSLRLACLLLILALSTLLSAQEDEPVHVLTPNGLPSAPDPVKPVDVRSRVFVSAPDASGSGVHNVLYAALDRSTEFQLVNDPAKADQIFEVHIVESGYYTPPDQVPPDYSIVLNILDNKGRFVRGPYTVKAKSARLERNVEKNLRQAIDTLVRQISSVGIPAGIKLAIKGDEKVHPPAPAPFSRVKTVFVSGVRDKTDAMRAKAPGDLYKQFCAAMQKWGRYKLLPSAEGADLVIDLAVSMHPESLPPGAVPMHASLYFKDPNFYPQAEVRMTLTSSNLVYGYNTYLSWAMLGGRRGLILLTSQKALQQSAESLVDGLRRITTSADAAEAMAKAGGD